MRASGDRLAASASSHCRKAADCCMLPTCRSILDCKSGTPLLYTQFCSVLKVSIVWITKVQAESGLPCQIS